MVQTARGVATGRFLWTKNVLHRFNKNSVQVRYYSVITNDREEPP